MGKQKNLAINPKDFQAYRDIFEQNVVAKGAIAGILGKMQLISTKPCRLAKSDFAKHMGLEFVHPIAIAIDYYGLTKRSTGCRSVIETNGMQELLIVYFASIKISHINFLKRDLLVDFVDFKEEVIRLRKFNKSE